MSHFSGVAPAGIFVVVSAGEGLGCVAVARRGAVAASAMACVLACVLTWWAAGLAATSACLRLIGVAKRGNPAVGILDLLEYSVRYEGCVAVEETLGEYGVTCLLSRAYMCFVWSSNAE